MVLRRNSVRYTVTPEKGGCSAMCSALHACYTSSKVFVTGRATPLLHCYRHQMLHTPLIGGVAGVAGAVAACSAKGLPCAW